MTASGHHEQLLRDLMPQVLVAVTRRHGDFALAEDAVQEALLAASSAWREQGLPDNPRAWLIQVAARRLTDALRAQSARFKRETKLADAVPDIERMQPPLDEAPESEKDDTLLLLFMCCHPALSRSSAIALTLRAVAGLTTAEIARAFLVPEATMGQRISRAKQQIKASNVSLTMPTGDERGPRLSAVRHVLYLIFNEGYTVSGGESLTRVDLSSEAIRLTRAALRVLPDDAELEALLALMLLTDSRRLARTGAAGEIIPLDEQNRGLWERSAIAEGTELLERALSRGNVGAYQLQAAIAACHARAASAADTDWPQILMLYGLLERMSNSPMVTLNRAVALAMVHGPAAGLQLLSTLDGDARVSQHHRLAAVRAHLHERAGELDAAVTQYQLAAERTASTPEREYLMLRAASLRERRS